MAHTIHGDPFATDQDFNEQLYSALRQSPWWMVSIALHVFAFVLLTLLDTSDSGATEKNKHVIRASMPEEVLVEKDPIEKTEHPDPVDLVPVEDPFEVEKPEIDVPADDNDVQSEVPEPFGRSEGDAPGDFEGPQNNRLVGLAGGASSGAMGDGFNRTGGRRAGGGDGFDEALDDALRWLAAHQSPNGGWEAAAFDRWCDGKPVSDPSRRPDGLGKAMYDPGVTGLALCAFLGAGYTNRGKHPFARVVSKGLRFLKNIQDPEGCFGPRSTQQYIYNHATAALAMVEAYGMTGSPVWKGAAQRALDFIAVARNPYFAWRYGIKPGDNDTSVTGWMMMALKSAAIVNAAAKRNGKQPPLTYDEASFDGVRAWLDKVTDPDYGSVGYIQRGTGAARPQELVDRFPAEKSESMTAVGVLARIFCGEDPRKSDIIQMGAALCAKKPPTWNATDGSIDMYYWYYGTLAMFQVGGKPWSAWRAAMDKAVVQSQRKDTDYCQYKGSWDPIGPWGPDGGRVYSTALMAMCLAVYYRYPKVFGASSK